MAEVFKGFYEGFLDHILDFTVVSQEIPAGADKGLFIGVVKFLKSGGLALKNALNKFLFVWIQGNTSNNKGYRRHMDPLKDLEIIQKKGG
jgi:hypothetical protein